MLKRNRLLLILVVILCITWIVQLASSEPLTNQVRKVSEKTKLDVKQRDNFQCILCGNKENLQIDHIIPLWKGGSNDIKNLQTLCSNHHYQKSREENKEYRVFFNEILQKYNNKCSYCGARAPPLGLTFKAPPETGGKYSPENLKTICKTCADKPRAIIANGNIVEIGKNIPNTDFIVELINESLVTLKTPKNKEIIVHDLKKEGKTVTNHFRIEGSFKYCEYCGKEVYGWCTMRKKYVCEEHRRFTQGTTRWICP
jgi:5-methylcytosine-specific restriction enzyme A